MTGADHDRRHSVAENPALIADPVALAEAEARNGLKQFDLGLRIIEDALAKGAGFRIRPSMLLALHRQALEGLSDKAGVWRPAGVGIEGSAHKPIGAHLVPEAIEEMCDYINDHRGSCTPVHLSAYAMWRLNWIHPFVDGNGRTSRIFSYCILCIALGFPLPGTLTIPDQIVANRKPYFDALESADHAFAEQRIDVSQMESLLERLLAAQLVSAFEKATGKTDLG